MAVDKLVDSTELDNGLTTIADAIRTKGGTSAPLAFPDGMAQAIADIPTGITPTGNINITDTNVTDVTNYATATVVDADLVAGNIKEGVNILGILGTFAGGGGGSLPSVISKIDGGSFTVATTTAASEFPISHTLGEEPKGFMVWSEPLIGGSNSMNCAIATNYSIATSDLTNVKAAGGLLYSKGWAGYVGYNYLFDVKPDVFGADYIVMANVGVNYLAGCTYKWLAWA